MHSVKRKIQYGGAIGEKVYYPTKENVNEITVLRIVS
jgi:hypothetical protein